MKTKRYYLILTILIGLLCTPAFGRTGLSHSDEPGLVLLGRPNPTLAGIDKLWVVILPPCAEPNKDGLVWEELETEVKNKLQKAGIKTDFRIAGSILNIPELRVNVNMLKLEDQQYVFHIRTSLSRAVRLAVKGKLRFKTDVWKTEPVMQAIPIKDMPAKVTDAVLEQAEAFIVAWLAANPKPTQWADANNISTVPKEQTTPAAKSTVAEYKYVASKNSKVFHRPQCSAAKRIKPENIVTYSSRAEVIRDGKRPCKLCKP